jgi:hypothetical protein
MKRKSLIAALALAGAPAFTASAATTFYFEGGAFVSGTDLSPGTYDLSSLGYFSVEFSLGAPPGSNSPTVTL